jgi:hypothetical protein
MYVRGYLQGSENGRVVTIDHKEDCVFNAHAHVAVELSVLAITRATNKRIGLISPLE